MIPGRDRFVPTDPDTKHMDDIHERAARIAGLVRAKLTRPKLEANTMAGGYFIDSAGKRRDFDGAGQETTSGTGGVQATPRLSRSPGNANPATTPLGLTRPLEPTATPTFRLTRPSAPQPVTAPAGAQIVNPASAGGNNRLRRGGVSQSEAERRMQMGLDRASFYARSSGLTRSQRQAVSQAGMAEANYWAQAAGREAPLARGEREKLAMTNDAAMQAAGINNQSRLQVAGMNNQTQLQAEQMRQQGGIDRATVAGQFALRRPQKPIQLGDDTLAAPGPDGTLQLLTLPDGTLARGPSAQQGAPINQTALSRLVPGLAEQFLGADQYGMIRDPNAKGGRRAATAEDRQAAYQQAVAAARETLGGTPPSPAPAPPPAPTPTSSAAPAGGRPASLEEFLDRAVKQNPDYSREELIQFFEQTYGAR